MALALRSARSVSAFGARSMPRQSFNARHFALQCLSLFCLVASCLSAAIPDPATQRRTLRSLQATTTTTSSTTTSASSLGQPQGGSETHEIIIWDQRGGGIGPKEGLKQHHGTRSTATFPASTSRRSSSPPAQSVAPWIDGCKSALSSAMSAACVKTLLQPVDAIKTYQQYTYATSGSAVSLLNAVRAISKHGWGRFYAGLGVTVLGSMPGVAIYFGVYSYCKNRLLSTEFGHNHATLSVAASAALGNSVASFSRVPYEVMKQQLQTGTYSSTWEALAAIFASTGPQSALRLVFPRGGVAAQMWRDVPYAVVTLLLYESLQGRVRKRYGSSTDDDSPERRRRRKVIDFCVGGIAGGMGSWVTNPQDVIKTRLQTNSEAYGGSVTACAAALWREGGPSVFLRGSVPRLLHKVPANAFFFLFYEAFRRLLRVSDTIAPEPRPKPRTSRR